MAKSKATIFFLLLTSFVYGQAFSFDTTLVNNKQSFHIKSKAIANDLLLLTSSSGTLVNLIDTIESNGLAYIEYPDFNSDGNADILIDYYGNNSTYFLYLFDPKTNRFIEIENYSRFPDAIQLKSNLNYYYSYHRAGCADMNWVSDFFKIEDFKIIQLGHIYGKGCDSEVKSPQVIEVYKVQNNSEEKRVLIRKLSYLKYIPEMGDKWKFIEKYWNENYRKFE